MHISQKLKLNISPIAFSETHIEIGYLPNTNKDDYQHLVNEYFDEVAFKFDSRSNQITYVAFKGDPKLGGTKDLVPVNEHLYLVGKALQQSILVWIKDNREITRFGRKLAFWGSKNSSRLLSASLEQLGLKPIHGLETMVRYELNTEILFKKPTANNSEAYLGLAIDIRTSNVIDLTAEELIKLGVPIIGKYVGVKSKEEYEFIRPRVKLLGRVIGIKEDKLILTDSEVDSISVKKAYIEPRTENLLSVIAKYYPDKLNYIDARLKEAHGPYSTANIKEDKISTFVKLLQKHHSIKLAPSVKVDFLDLLSNQTEWFPPAIPMSRPTFLLGPQGTNTYSYPDLGIARYGPYKYLQHKINEPVIGVICLKKNRGRFEQFINQLKNGYPEETWNYSTSWMSRKRDNPFSGGLLGKYRLRAAKILFEEVVTNTPEEYEQACRRVLGRTTGSLDLAIIQTDESYKSLYGVENPYFVSKAIFMSAGTSVQAIKLETIDKDTYDLAYILNSIGLAAYAKMSGIPWLLSTVATHSHELVIGLGSAELSASKLGDKHKFVGITTVFQGDGRYSVWGITREVPYENYADELNSSLELAIEHVAQENNWQPNDSVLLVFHAYKPLKNIEISAVKRLVTRLTGDAYNVKYAFINISHSHSFQLFAPDNQGKRYKSAGVSKYRGKGVPERGICIQLSKRTGLIQLTGPSELRSSTQGIPKALKIDVHPDSDYVDLTYLMRQIYSFTYMSWQSFTPASEPVTIYYSKLIARMLGNLKNIPAWNSNTVEFGNLKDRKWFL